MQDFSVNTNEGNNLVSFWGLRPKSLINNTKRNKVWDVLLLYTNLLFQTYTEFDRALQSKICADILC